MATVIRFSVVVFAKASIEAGYPGGLARFMYIHVFGAA
jgi:hypothetical protein